jgi:antirestriction protein ArdC
MMNAKIEQALQNIVQRFKEGDIPEAIAYSIFPIPNIPASQWSLLNRTLMFISGTSDARGFRQWNEVGRYVKKGSHSFTILAPRFIKTQSDEEETEPILAGFLAVPVFKVEDTEGEPLDYQNIELPELPLMEVAKDWNISVKAVPGNYQYSGYFCQDRKEIDLASKEETVFFHELAHAAHQKLLGKLKKGQDWRQEIVAELAAATLCQIVGRTSKHLGTSYRYVEEYAKNAKLTPWQACLKVFSDTEKVLTLILDWKSPPPFPSYPATREEGKEVGLKESQGYTQPG